MVKKALAFVVILGMGISLSASDSDFLEFKGGIGVDPTSNVTVSGGVVTVTANVVRTVTPGGLPWRIGSLKAEIEANGSIEVKGKGLLLAAGDKIGTNGGVKVMATLICEATAPFTLHNTNVAGVLLDPDGDFRIDDVLSGVLPLTCASPVLLIRGTSGTTADGWLAAGILDREDHDEDDD